MGGRESMADHDDKKGIAKPPGYAVQSRAGDHSILTRTASSQRFPVYFHLVKLRKPSNAA
jgi:hypothetical protein